MKERLPYAALQSALWQRLTVALDPVRLYDEVPGDAAYPHVTLGEFRREDQRTKTSFTCIVRGTLYVVSGAAGMKESELIADTLIQALVREDPLDLSSDGFRVLDTVNTESMTAKIPAQVGLVRALVLSFAWKIQQLS